MQWIVKCLCAGIQFYRKKRHRDILNWQLHTGPILPCCKRYLKCPKKKNKKKLVIGQLVRLVKLIHLLPFRSIFCFPMFIEKLIYLYLILHVINILLVFYSPEINDLWQIIIASSMGKQLMV